MELNLSIGTLGLSLGTLFQVTLGTDVRNNLFSYIIASNMLGLRYNAVRPDAFRVY